MIARRFYAAAAKLSTKPPGNSGATTATTSTLPALSWTDYFKMKIQRERVARLVGIPAAFGTMFGVIGGYEFNPVEPILGMDPSIMVFIGTLGSGFFGYQVGTFMGHRLYSLAKYNLHKSIDAKDTSFYTRIRTYRVNRPQLNYVPGIVRTGSKLSAVFARSAEKKKAAEDLASSNAAADYHGEKIKSVADYRAWLRRQRTWLRQQYGKGYQPIRGVKE